MEFDRRELRIGNLVSFKGKWTGEVSELREVTLSIKNNGGVFTYDQFNGIPLTEEWLVRFGANYNLGKYWIGVRLAVELYDEETYLVYFVDKHSTCTHLYRKIKYVHQLQNLYFALTGEELTYDN